MLAAMAPRVLHRAITVFAWLAVPLWCGAVAGDLAGVPDRDVVLLTGAAVTATGCALRIWHEDRTDARIERGLSAAERNQLTMAAAMELMAGRPLPPALVPSQSRGEDPALRLVHPAPPR